VVFSSLLISGCAVTAKEFFDEQAPSQQSTLPNNATEFGHYFFVLSVSFKKSTHQSITNNMVIHTRRLTTRVLFWPDGERVDISLLWVSEY
jgi:hypothetical protein